MLSSSGGPSSDGRVTTAYPHLIPDDRLEPLPYEEQVRTARHLALFDQCVQQRFAAARVCVIGAGGLGSPLLSALAAAGVGTNGRITVCDDDTVELTNLQRQTLFGVQDVGRAKVVVARERMEAMNPSITVAAAGRFDAGNAEQLCRDHDILSDGSDNFATRFVAADAAEITGTPLVWGAVLRYEGHVSVFWSPRGPGLRDLFNGPPLKPVVTCAEAGVLGATTAVVGNLMATEALKVLGGLGEPLVGRVLTYHALTSTTRTLRLRRDPSRDPASAICGSSASSVGDASRETSHNLPHLCSPGSGDAVDTARVPGDPSHAASATPSSRPAGQAALAWSMAPSDLPAFLANETHVLVDVRDDYERLIERITLDGRVTAGGATPEASGPRDIHVPVGQVMADAAAVQIPDSATAVVVYCARGVRSQQAAAALRETLIVPVYSLEGGIAAAK